MSMFSRTLPTIVIASKSAVVKGSMTPEVILHNAWKKSTECWKSAHSMRITWEAYPVSRQRILACDHELSSARYPAERYLVAHQNDTVLSHSSGDDKRIMPKGITVLDFCVISLMPPLSPDPAYGLQVLRYLIIS
jgi:hypothetical protein